MLHVLNGESTAQTLRESGLAGEHLVWKEALVWGPTPGNFALAGVVPPSCGVSRRGEQHRYTAVL
jgi:hypothetical protein